MKSIVKNALAISALFILPGCLDYSWCGKKEQNQEIQGTSPIQEDNEIIKSGTCSHKNCKHNHNKNVHKKHPKKDEVTTQFIDNIDEIDNIYDMDDENEDEIESEDNGEEDEDLYTN